MKMLLCSVCQSVHYCSAECQRSHWKAGHKAECTFMSWRRQQLGQQAHDDMKKWSDKNRGYLAALAGKMLQAYSKNGSMLTSHVVFMDAAYNTQRRSLDVSIPIVMSADAAQAALDDRQEQLALSAYEPIDLKLLLRDQPYRQMTERFKYGLRGIAVILLSTSIDDASGVLLKVLPMALENVSDVSEDPLDGVCIDSVIHALNTGVVGAGSCGRAADKINAIAVADDIVEKYGLTLNRRIGELRAGLAAHLSDLLFGVLRLGSKRLSLRKTHCMRVVLKHDRVTEQSKVVKCEAIEISKLLDQWRIHMPVVQVESRLGTSNDSCMEELFRGTSQQIRAEAKQRESVYLPCLLVELSDSGMHQFHLPNFLWKSLVKRYQKLNLSVEAHIEILNAEFRKMSPIAGLPVGCADELTSSAVRPASVPVDTCNSSSSESTCSGRPADVGSSRREFMDFD